MVELVFIDKIEGFPDYEIYSDGRVFSHKGKGRFLKPWKGTDGRMYVDLYDENDEKKHKQIHCLLGEVFIPNPNNLPELDHKDGNPLNNSLSNLRWCNSSQNKQNQGISSRNTSGRKGVGFFKKTQKWVARIMINGVYKESKSFSTFEEAVSFREYLEEKYFDPEFYRVE